MCMHVSFMFQIVIKMMTSLFVLDRPRVNWHVTQVSSYFCRQQTNSLCTFHLPLPFGSQTNGCAAEILARSQVRVPPAGPSNSDSVSQVTVAAELLEMVQYKHRKHVVLHLGGIKPKIWLRSSLVKKLMFHVYMDT